MVDVIVEYEYSAKEEDELTLKVGDVVTNVKMMDGGWWEGELRGKRGVFPDNFVKEIKKEDKKASEPPPIAKKEGRSHVAELANKLGRGGGIKVGQPMPVVMRKGQDPDKKKVRAKVTFSYSPENEDELRLEVGETVDILDQVEEGWWEAVLNGKKGMIPSNFVEIIEGGTAENADHEENEVKEIQAKKVKGFGLGNIFSEGPIKLRSTASAKEPKAELRNDQHKGPVEAKRSSTRNAPQVPRDAPVSAAGEGKPEFSGYSCTVKAYENQDHSKIGEQEKGQFTGLGNDQYLNLVKASVVKSTGTGHTLCVEQQSSEFTNLPRGTDLLQNEFDYCSNSNNHGVSETEISEDMACSSLSYNLWTYADSRQRGLSDTASGSVLTADGRLLCENLGWPHNRDTYSSDGDLSLVVNCASRDLDSCSSRCSIETDSLDMPDTQVCIAGRVDNFSDGAVTKENIERNLEMSGKEGQTEEPSHVSMDGSGDVPVILTSLGRARQTPPPKPSFRKRRSLGTPKHSTPKGVKRQKLAEKQNDQLLKQIVADKKGVHDDHRDKMVAICTRDLLIDTESSDSLDTNKTVVSNQRYGSGRGYIHILEADKVNDSMEITRKKLSLSDNGFKISPQKDVSADITVTKDGVASYRSENSMSSDSNSQEENDSTKVTSGGPAESLSSTPEKTTCMNNIKKFPKLLKCFIPWNSSKMGKESHQSGDNNDMINTKYSDTVSMHSSRSSMSCRENETLVCHEYDEEQMEKPETEEFRADLTVRMEVEDKETYLQHLYSTGRLTPTLRSVSDKYGLLNPEIYRSRRSSSLYSAAKSPLIMPENKFLSYNRLSSMPEAKTSGVKITDNMQEESSHDDTYSHEEPLSVPFREVKVKQRNKWSKLFHGFSKLKVRKRKKFITDTVLHPDKSERVSEMQVCDMEGKQGSQTKSETNVVMPDRIEMNFEKKDYHESLKSACLVTKLTATSEESKANRKHTDKVSCEAGKEEIVKEGEIGTSVHVNDIDLTETGIFQSSICDNLNGTHVDTEPEILSFDPNLNNSSNNLLEQDTFEQEFEKWLVESMSELTISDDKPWESLLHTSAFTPEGTVNSQKLNEKAVMAHKKPQSDASPLTAPDTVALEPLSGNAATSVHETAKFMQGYVAYDVNGRAEHGSERQGSFSDSVQHITETKSQRADTKVQAGAMSALSEISKTVAGTRTSEQEASTQADTNNASPVWSSWQRQSETQSFNPALGIRRQYVEHIWSPSPREQKCIQQFTQSQDAGTAHSSVENQYGIKMDAEDGLVISRGDVECSYEEAVDYGGVLVPECLACNDTSPSAIKNVSLNCFTDETQEPGGFVEDQESLRQRDPRTPEDNVTVVTDYIDDIIRSCIYSSAPVPHDSVSEDDRFVETCELQLLQKSMDDDEYCIDYDGSLLIDGWRREERKLGDQDQNSSAVAKNVNNMNKNQMFLRQEEQDTFQFERRPTFINEDFLNDCLEAIENPTNFICSQNSTDFQSNFSDLLVNTPKGKFYHLASVTYDMT